VWEMYIKLCMYVYIIDFMFDMNICNKTDISTFSVNSF
jgi:hypothetical protein